MRHYLEVVYWDAEQFSPVKPSALARESAGSEPLSTAEAGGLGPGSGNEAKDVARLAKLRKRLRQAISASNGAQPTPIMLPGLCPRDTEDGQVDSCNACQLDASDG